MGSRFIRCDILATRFQPLLIRHHRAWPKLLQGRSVKHNKWGNSWLIRSIRAICKVVQLDYGYMYPVHEVSTLKSLP